MVRNPLFSIPLVRRCPWAVRARALCSMQVSAVHLYISALSRFFPDKMRMRLETCIICNRYRPLMVSALPLAACNGPFLRFSAPCSAFLMVTEWGQRVSPGKRHDERRDLSFSCQEVGIASTSHDAQTESACTRSGRKQQEGDLSFTRKTFHSLISLQRQRKEEQCRISRNSWLIPQINVSIVDTSNHNKTLSPTIFITL